MVLLLSRLTLSAASSYKTNVIYVFEEFERKSVQAVAS